MYTVDNTSNCCSSCSIPSSVSLSSISSNLLLGNSKPVQQKFAHDPLRIGPKLVCMQYLWFYEARQNFTLRCCVASWLWPTKMSDYTILKHEEWAFIWYIVWLHSVKLSCVAVSQCLTIDLSKSAAWNR